MKMRLLAVDFVVCKVADTSQINFNQKYMFYARTDDEISLVCPAGSMPLNAIKTEPGWCAFKVCGVLDFGLVGILSKITGILADNGIGLFAISTYNTDYILVKRNMENKAVTVLLDNGYEVEREA